MTLNEYVFRLAKASGKKPIEIAEIAGASEGWAKVYLRGHIESPQVDKIERLYTGLTGRKLITDDDVAVNA